MMKSQAILVFLFVMSFASKAQSNSSELSFNNFIDSMRTVLIDDGVDTILIYSKGCVHCLPEEREKHMHDINGNIFLDSSKHIYKNYLPRYIFWVKNGHYFVKKIDQLGSYKTVERSRWQHYQIYDFLFRNLDGIKVNSLLQYNYEVLDISSKHPYAYIYDIVYDHPVTETDYTEINFTADTLTLNLRFNDDFYKPITKSKDSLKSGNSSYTYYYNMMLERSEWKRIIESELFEIEFKHLWILEDN